MPDSNQRSPLTLEDLLRLKRAERPAPEFWTRFESELRQKQLAALVQSRPWWHLVPQILAQRRSVMPLGASAILALTLISVKFHSPHQTSPAESFSAGQIVTQQTGSEVVGGVSVVGQPSAMVTSVLAVAEEPSEQAAMVGPAPLSEHLPEHASTLTPWSVPLPAQLPSYRMIANHFAPSEILESRLGQTLSGNPVSLGLAGAQRSGGAVAELASVSALTSKRTRLLAQFNERQFSPEPQAPAQVRERLTRRLADADTNASDHFTRLGLRGDQVSLKF